MRLVESLPADVVPVVCAWPVRISKGAKLMEDVGLVAELRPGTFAALVGECGASRMETG